MTGSTKSLGRLATAAAMVMGLLVPGVARAQVGALGGAAGGAFSGDDAVSQGPVFGESGLVLDQGAWSFGGYFGRTSASFDTEFFDLEFGYNQLIVGAFYGLSDKLSVGAVIPFSSWSAETPLGDADASGLGDIAGVLKYQFVESADGKTHVAAIGNVSLPTGDEEEALGAGDPVFGIGGALSHALSSASLHANAGVGFTTGDNSTTVLSFGGGVVFPVSPTVMLSGELLGNSYETEDFLGESERTTVFDLAPGARFRVGSSTFIDAGVNIPLDNEKSGYDWAAMIGVSIVR